VIDTSVFPASAKPQHVVLKLYFKSGCGYYTGTNYKDIVLEEYDTILDFNSVYEKMLQVQIQAVYNETFRVPFWIDSYNVRFWDGIDLPGCARCGRYLSSWCEYPYIKR
jgi:hypothetical protein